MNGVLPRQEILTLIPGVIVNGDAKCVGTASYDMRIGADYYLHDEKCPNGTEIRSRQPQGVIVIPPNGLLMCTMYETLKMPADIVGHLSLKVPLLMKGIIIASQSQIDAGYEGKIFGLLYNLSQRAVCLKDGELVLKLELIRLEQATSKPYDSTVSKTASLSTYINAPLVSSLVSIRREASTARRLVSRTQLVGTLAVATAGLIATWHFAPDSKVEQLSQTISSLQSQIAAAQAAVPSLVRLNELERQNKALQEKLDKMEPGMRQQTSERRAP